MQLKKNINNFKSNFKSFSPLICFAVKANTNTSLIREIRKLGLGADVVSAGELMKALKAGINPKKIVFSGVGKTSAEIRYAIEKKILLINAESKSEIFEIEKIAKSKKKIINIGIRLNPNTDAKTLNQISTGKQENKFGVNKKTFFELVKYSQNSKNIKLKCLSVHIGSQIIDHRPYEKMLRVVNKIIKKTNYEFEFIDLGGGMGIPYENNNKKLNYKKYNIAIKKFLKNHKSRIIFEPGRSIVGNIGVLISKVIYIKESAKKNFIILDVAMNDLMRPALYGTNHRTLPVLKTKQVSKKTYEFVGPICESTDKFITLKKFQKLKEKDLVVMCDVGAYGMSLSSNYNVRPKPIEILIKGSKINVIKKRQKLTDII
jgi:diaminopimelate decarboxylase